MVTILSAASLVGVLSVALALSSLLSLLRIGAIFCVAIEVAILCCYRWSYFVLL